MKVKCVKTQIEQDYGCYKAFENFEDTLSVGNEFYVYGLSFEYGDLKTGVYIYAFPKISHIIWLPLELFDIIDDRIPDCWRVYQSSDSRISLYAEILLQDHFLENFSEYEPKERAEFAEFRKIYEK